jgi:hypothetical protein
VRWANVVFAKGKWILIDLEDAAELTAVSTHTPQHDLVMLGRNSAHSLSHCSGHPLFSRLEGALDSMLTAEDALQDPWMQL